MKKYLRGIVIAVLLITMLATLTACNKYKWDAVGTKDYSDEAVIGNGSLAVQQGKYLYFVNGADSTTLTKKAENEWGSASIKGSIMKSEINDDGTLTCLGVVVPKTFYSTSTQAGLYIYGEWLYFVTKTEKTDNKGALISGIEFMRTKIDGTKTQSIAVVLDETSTFLFTENGLMYSYENNLHFVSYTDKKIGKDSTTVEEYTDLEVSKEDQCIFYTVASGNEYVTSNKLGVVEKDGSAKIIIENNAYYVGDGTYYEDLSTQYTLAIIGYNAADNSLYYTKTCLDAKAEAGTYGYKFTEGYTFDKANEKQFAKSALTTIYSLGFDKGIVNTTAAAVKVFAPMSTGVEVASEDQTFASTITILFTQKIDAVNYTYYIETSNFYRTTLFNEDGTINAKPTVEKISDVAANITKWGTTSVIGDNIYYLSSDDTAYLYRINYTAFESGANTLTKVKGYIVSGYKSYTYGEDEDFVINKDDEAIKDKVPAYMTDADSKTYITSHQTANS